MRFSVNNSEVRPARALNLDAVNDGKVGRVDTAGRECAHFFDNVAGHAVEAVRDNDARLVVREPHSDVQELAVAGDVHGSRNCPSVGRRRRHVCAGCGGEDRNLGTQA